MTINLSQLSTPLVLEPLDFEQIYEAMLDEFMERWDAKRLINPDLPEFTAGELESEPLVTVLEAAAARELNLRARVNDASAKANLIAFASGSDLDHQAAFYGVTRLEDETDEALRSRVVLAIQGRSAGGPEERYAFVARSASVRVRDVAVYRDGPGPNIVIAIRSTDNGGIPDAGLLEDVTEAVNAKDVALVSDTISVIAGISAVVNISAEVWLLPDAPASISSSLEAILRAAWDVESGMGFDLNPSWIKARLHVAGVSKVDVLAPLASVVVDENNAIALGSVTITYKGRSR